MQNRYVGDVGDFAKYGLLRSIARETGYRLAIIWYLFENEDHNADGRHVGYLCDPSFESIDPPLYSALQRMVRAGRRSVSAVERSGILPSSTIYFSKPICEDRTRFTKRIDRTRLRAAWLRSALTEARDSEIVFFDPDNGLETPSVPRNSPKSGKYVYWDELIQFWDRGKSLLVYHHLNRTATVARQTETLQSKFAERFTDSALITHFLARRGSCRHFWLVSQPSHVDALKRATSAVRHSRWREYLEVG